MRVAVLAVSSLMLACGTRTELSSPDQLGLCSPPFAEGIEAFDLTGDEVIALKRPGVVAFDKRTGVLRVVAESSDAHTFVVTNGREIAWTTQGTGLKRVPVMGGAPTEVLRGFWYSWETPGESGLAMNSAGVIVLIAGWPQVFGAEDRLELAGPIAMRGDRVVGFREGGSMLVEQRLGEPSARVLLEELTREPDYGRLQRSVRIAPDDSTWVVSGRGDYLTNPEVWPRVHHVHRDGATHVVYRADRLTALSVDAQDDAAFVATVSNPLDDGPPGLRIDQWSDDGSRRTPLVRCAGLSGNPRFGSIPARSGCSSATAGSSTVSRADQSEAPPCKGRGLLLRFAPLFLKGLSRPRPLPVDRNGKPCESRRDAAAARRRRVLQ